ncbi:hypothetical protein MHUMG1_07345 [Metarhizium humberi]|uniref:L-tryptophan decarboxylase PsiD-like domain-containing protein n=1 Tax=Metarhizium humberi TaxID=2596975 RepID=A0A9P8M5Q7_9HYPO|nr:hypothetical protein MHUMG1_07345 [Metarhizium humberi]
MVHQHGDHHDIPSEYRIHRPGAWLPADHRVHRQYLSNVTRHIDSHPKQPLTPALEEFRQLIEGNSRIYMYFVQMFDEIPRRHPYWRDPTGGKQIRDYEHMLQVLNHIVTRAPEWTEAAESVGVTPESAEVLGDHGLGWFGQTGMSDLVQVANMPYQSSMKFEDMFVCDPSAKHMGFKSWDDFFTRRVHDAARPVADPDDDSVIANACESSVFNVAHGVGLRDKFFAKGQPYSLVDMFAHDALAHEFVGGTIYQAFLSALSYHRWHSPVSGTVRRAFVQDGTYFSEPLSEDEGDPRVEIDTRGISVAQGYLSALAARAIIVLEADNPKIGLLGFIGIGMDEVSTCDITVKEGQRLKKGDQLGMFHFGGSSHCLVFQRGVRVDGFPPVGRQENVPVRGKLAVVH